MKNNIPWYGTCSTAAATTAKKATSTDSKFSLVTGAKVRIKFTYTNTASAPTLNVDSKGAKYIKAYDTTAPTIWWNAGDVVDFTYDGTNWIMGATQGEVEQLKSDLANIANNASVIKEFGSQSETVTVDFTQYRFLLLTLYTNLNGGEIDSSTIVVVLGNSVATRFKSEYYLPSTDTRYWALVTRSGNTFTCVTDSVNTIGTLYGIK